MKGSYKKIALRPPAGDAVARYSVTAKEEDIRFHHFVRTFIPSIVRSVIYLLIFILGEWIFAKIVNSALSAIDAAHLAPGVGFYAVIAAIYALWRAGLIIWQTYCFNKSVPSAVGNAGLTEFGFFGGGYIYSNNSDLIRIDWKHLTFALETKRGLFLLPFGRATLQFIPARYLCAEYAQLRKILIKQLSVRFIRCSALGRARAPQYENAARTVTVFIPDGEPIARLKVTLGIPDLLRLSGMWRRQIAERGRRGIFGFVSLALCMLIDLVLLISTGEAMLSAIAGIIMIVAAVYLLYLFLSSFLHGFGLLVNKPDFTKPVSYDFYEDGVLVIYENGVSFVRYRDLGSIVEDVEGMALFFSRKSLLFIPERVMKTRQGITLSHMLKVELFSNEDVLRMQKYYKLRKVRKKPQKPQKPQKPRGLDMFD